MVYGLPKNKNVQEENDRLRDYLYRRFGEEKIMLSYVMGDYTISYQIYQELKQLKLKLRHYQQFVIEYGIRPTKRKHFWNVERIDLISQIEEQICNKEQEFSISLHLKDKTSGNGFIVCRTVNDKYTILSHFEREKKTGYRWLILKQAPPPDEILWENLNVPIQFKILFRIFVYVAFILLFLIFMTPASFLNYLDTILGSDDLTGYKKVLVKNYLPPLFLLIYQAVILPQFINIIVTQEKHTSRSKQTLSAMHKYMIYNLVYIFLVPAVGYSLMDLLIGAFEEGIRAWQIRITESIAHTGYFFSNFIVHQTFIKSGMDLLTPLRLLEIKITQISALSSEEKLLAYQAPEFNWSSQFAITLTNLVIILSMGIIYPVMLGLGVMYFFMRYFVNKYVLLCVCYINHHQVGVRLLRAILRYFSLGILIFQAVTVSQLMLHDSDIIRGFGSAIFFASLAVFIFCNRKTARLLQHFKRRVLRKALTIDSIQTVNRDPTEYMHPIQKILNSETVNLDLLH